mgnify:CR=1 FL=1
MTRSISLQLATVALVGALFAGCSGGPMTTREKGAGIGALGGAAAGGIIGTTVGHPGAGAAIGGAAGLGGRRAGRRLHARSGTAAVSVQSTTDSAESTHHRP